MAVSGAVLDLLSDIRTVSGDVDEVANDALVLLDISGYCRSSAEEL